MHSKRGKQYITNLMSKKAGKSEILLSLFFVFLKIYLHPHFVGFFGNYRSLRLQFYL